MAPVEELKLFEDRLRALAAQSGLEGLDNAFEQAKLEHQHLADRADELLRIKHQIQLEML
ncbi:MAG: hypothetical protein F6K00_01220 [Leptolyngbya sp. SIOISBB]|nr:hypothetical protein [Leptolyngbya sp. SIOISBB]